MARRLVEQFAVGDPVEIDLQARSGLVSIPCVVVAHAHPGIWVAAATGARWFVTNGNRVRARPVRLASAQEPPRDMRSPDRLDAHEAHPTLYKIAARSEWEATERAGVWPGSPADLRDGYVHLSTAAQVRDTAARHFSDREDLVLLDVAAARLDAGTLRWEPSRGGALFPHVHGPLRRDAVVRVRPLPRGADGRHVFPDDVGTPGGM